MPDQVSRQPLCFLLDFSFSPVTPESSKDTFETRIRHRLGFSKCLNMDPQHSQLILVQQNSSLGISASLNSFLYLTKSLLPNGNSLGSLLYLKNYTYSIDVDLRFSEPQLSHLQNRHNSTSLFW